MLSESKNFLVDTLNLDVLMNRVDTNEVVTGNPSQGFVELGNVYGVDVGVWELRGGTVIDTEVDEIFVVVAGSGKVEILNDSGGVTDVFDLQTGSTMRLVAGTKTRWIVPEYVRKVYIAP